ncbi:MAG: PKD domain-containing protein, partial [Bacteroidota bacterium]
LYFNSSDWTLSGGSIIELTNEQIQIQFDSSGTYTVELIVNNEVGRDTIEQTFTITVINAPILGLSDSIVWLDLYLRDLSMFGDSTFWIIDNETFEQEADTFQFRFDTPGEHTYGLIVSNNCGRDTLLKTAFFDGLPVADFSFQDTSGCSPIFIQFENNSSNGADGFSWTFEGGIPSASSERNPRVGYDSSGAFSVSLTASNGFGDSTITQIIDLDIGQIPIAGFTPNINGLTVTFTNESTAGDTSLWAFGDGQISDVTSPQHTYTDYGDYMVFLTQSSECGIDSTSQLITLNIPPVAAFEVILSDNCAPATLNTINTSLGFVRSYNWVITGPEGFSAISSDTMPSFDLQLPGTYDLQLTVSNELGTSDTTISITIITTPIANFSFSSEDLNAQFENLSIDADSLLWAFGDGRFSSRENPSHQYPQDGFYNVQLIAFNECGTDTVNNQIVIGTAPIANFTIQNATGCAPHLVQYRNQSSGSISSLQWSFPGGQPATSTEQNPTVIYVNPGTYNASLRVDGILGSNQLTIDSAVQIVDFPIADFTYTIDGFEVSFTNGSENANAFSWTFGDGNQSRNENPIHTYTSGGVYTVTLNASFGNCATSVTKEIPVMLTSLDEINEKYQIVLYPNPVKNRLWIQSSLSDLDQATSNIINAQGQIIKSLKLNPDSSIHVGDLAQGIYYLQILLPEGSWNGKFVVQ